MRLLLVEDNVALAEELQERLTRDTQSIGSPTVVMLPTRGRSTLTI